MPTLREWLNKEPFTLTMSSGFFSFFAHCGMISVLEDEGITPAKITGSSAGALIGATWAAGCKAEKLKKVLFSCKRSDFWDPGLGIGLLKGKLLRGLIREISPVSKLENCRPPVVLSAFDALSWSTKIIKSGPFSNAVYASCAIPFLFHPIRIGNSLFFDGGLGDRHGLSGAENDSRIFYHHISSRSPWRKKNSPALKIPEQNGLVALVIKNLPRVGPFKLEQGISAYNKARSGTKEALAKKTENNKIQIS